MSEVNADSVRYHREVQRQQDVLRRHAANNAGKKDPYEDMSIDQLRQMMYRIAMDDDQKQQEILRADAAQQFLKKHPEYIPNEHNGRALTKCIEWKGMAGTSPEDLEQAYSELRDAGMVIIDETKAAQVEQENERLQKLGNAVASSQIRYQQMQEAEEAANPENMSTDELRDAIYRQQAESEDSGFAW
jgi:DNA-binding transcriptional regulator YhcF (GntR family)